jgi:hypothetical protein
MTTDKVAVPQEARDLFKTIYHYDDPDGERYVDEGRFDAFPRMQRLARFEAQARLAGKREGMESAIAAVEGERLADPQIGTSDDAYEQALTHAITAIREQKP